jgi:hypothetical protein
MSVRRTVFGSILVLLCISTLTTVLDRLQIRTVAWVVGVALLVANGLSTVYLLGR